MNEVYWRNIFISAFSEELFPGKDKLRKRKKNIFLATQFSRPWKRKLFAPFFLSLFFCNASHRGTLPTPKACVATGERDTPRQPNLSMYYLHHMLSLIIYDHSPVCRLSTRRWQDGWASLPRRRIERREVSPPKATRKAMRVWHPTVALRTERKEQLNWRVGHVWPTFFLSLNL